MMHSLVPGPSEIFSAGAESGLVPTVSERGNFPPKYRNGI